MRYLGGKSRLAKKFAPLLDEAIKDHGGNYVEPFVGGMNVLPHLPSVREALLSDIHPGLINMYGALQEGWIPPSDVGEDEYQELKDLKQANPHSAFVSFACSYGGKEWGGFARGKNSKGQWRNWADESARRLLGKFPIVGADVLFLCLPYARIPELSEPAVYYCDPPYRGTTGYKTGAFDHEAFDLWCERKVAEGNGVYVSEFNAPAHWDPVWSIDRAITCAKHNDIKKTDILFKVIPR